MSARYRIRRPCPRGQDERAGADAVADKCCGADNRVVADRGSSEHRSASGDPRTITDNDRRIIKFESGGAPVMATCAEEDPL